MPFREKAKRLFRTRSRSDSLSKTDSNSTVKDDGDVYYKPSEIPQSKYRAPPKKEHTEKLEAFSFGGAWRRKSQVSEYSPMGSKLPSRKSSFVSIGRRSMGSRSMAGRPASVASASTEKSAQPERDLPRGAARGTRLSTEVEQDGDDDATNVGLSRVHSHEKPAFSRPRTAEDRPPNGIAIVGTVAQDHEPFTEEDLALALKRSHLVVPAQG